MPSSCTSRVWGNWGINPVIEKQMEKTTETNVIQTDPASRSQLPKESRKKETSTHTHTTKITSKQASQPASKPANQQTSERASKRASKQSIQQTTPVDNACNRDSYTGQDTVTSAICSPLMACNFFINSTGEKSKNLGCCSGT